jgi:hypothetical protein
MNAITIADLVTRSHALAAEKGWHELWPDGKTKQHAVNVPEKLVLIHSEISEALEAFREFGVRLRCSNCSGVGKTQDAEFKTSDCLACAGKGFLESYLMTGSNPLNPLKPEGFVVELADAVIRIADLCGALGLDLAAAIELKHAFNVSRPFRHGGKNA